MKNTKNILIKTIKIILWIFVGVSILAILLFGFINTNAGKRTVRNQVVKYLENKLHTNVNIGSVDYTLPKWLKIKNFYIEDQHKDTLLFGEELSVDLDMVKLLQGNTDIKKVFLKNVIINVNRTEKDTAFNYQFLVDAFTGNKSTTKNKDTAGLKLTLRQLIFENVGFKFQDKYAGSNFSAFIKNLDLKTNKFQPDRLSFGIDNLTANGVKFYMKTYKEVETSIDNKLPFDTLTNSPYKFFISGSRVNLKDINVEIDNKVSGMYYYNQIGTLAGNNIFYSIEQEKGLADTLLLDSATIVFSSAKQEIPVSQNGSPEPTSWVYATTHLNINNSSLKYDDVNKPAARGLDFAHLDVKNIKAGIESFRFSTDSTKGKISQFSFSDKSGFVLDTTHVNLLFTDSLLSATDLYIKTPHSLIQNSFQLTYDSIAAITQTPQNSFIAATLNNSIIAFNDLYLLLPSLNTSLPQVQFANQTLHFNTVLRGNLKRLYLPYLQLSGLSGSKISANGTLFDITDPKRFSFDLNILQSNILKKDLLRFVPPANQAELASLPNLISLRGKLAGNTNSIAANVNATAKDLAFSGKINLTNIQDPKNIKYDLAFTNVAFNKTLIEGFIPPAALEQINLPQQISATGKFSGNTENVVMDLKAKSSYGPLTVKGYIKNIKTPERANYDLYVTTRGFALGKLIKQDSIIGNVAGAFIAKGTGFDYKTMNSSINANIASLQYNKYNYRNAQVNADFTHGVIKSIGKINDSSLQLTYDIVANVRDKYPTVKGEIDVDTAMLNKLHFTKDSINLSLRALVDAVNLQPRNLEASLLLDSVRMQTGPKFFTIDSTSLIATSQNGIDSVVLKAPFADVHAGGAFDYDKIGESIMRYVNNYYKIPGYTATTTNIADQQFTIKGSIKQSPFITTLVPGLNSYEDFIFTGSYASADRDSALNFNTAAKNVSFTSNNIANAALNINAKNAKINYEVTFDTLKTADDILYGTRLNGAAANDSLSLMVVTKDNATIDWFGLSGTAFVSNENYTLHMKDSLILNYEKWRVAPDNYISYGTAGIVVNNFLISSDAAKIDIRSKQLVGDSPIDISIDNFNLKSISSIVNKDTVLLAGILDVKATVSDFNKALPSFTGKASVKDIQFMQHPLGSITATAQKQSENNISATVNLLGANNDISAAGNYYLDSTTDQFDADLQVRALSFKTLEAFSADQLINSHGNISGNIKLNGAFSNPEYNGQVNFDTVKFSLAKLGAPYFIDKQKTILKYPQIQFPAFKVTDSLNNVLKIDGDITSRSITDYDLNVAIDTKDFVILNAKKNLHNELYGYAAVNVNVSVKGTSARPVIEGDILLNDKSDVKIVLPKTSYEKNDGKTIVRFVDVDTFKIDPLQAGFEPAVKPASEFAKFLNYNLNIELTKAAALTILVDPSTGDEIKVQGDARLNAGVDPGGNLVLAGVYELDKGYYDLHYNILNRKFNLIKGSTITFAGAPINAVANITAEYTALTSSKELLSNEVTDVSPTLANSFNQKLPFRVMLYLTGPLTKPNINFDIQLPEESNFLNGDLRTTIENKLLQIRNDPASINKQVFSLLLFNRFVSEQSSDFFKGNGGDFNDLARQSVSQFLSSALNEIAGDIFKGIDIDLNLNSYNDYSKGGNTQRTDLNLAVSKSFANDRLVISVGKNFGIEGQDAAAKSAGTNTGFKPDITIAYKLTTDGKYLMRAYTKNQFEVTLDGYVVETGLSFVVTLDYDKFNDLFIRKKKVNK